MLKIIFTVFAGTLSALLYNLCAANKEPYVDGAFYSYYGNYDDPSNGFEEPVNVLNNFYVTYDGFLDIKGLDIYEHLKENYPAEYMEAPVQNDLNSMVVGYVMEFIGIDNIPQTLRGNIPLPDGVLSLPFLSAGRYKDITVQLEHTGPEKITQGYTFSAFTSLVRPSVHKIPVYFDISLLNEKRLGKEDWDEELFYQADMQRELTKQVSYLNLGINNPKDKRHDKCFTMYEFVFFGYINASDDGVLREGDLQKLPPGITIVPSIAFCAGEGDNIAGCAIKSGNKIAVHDDYLPHFYIDPYDEYQLTNTVLHEIGHTQGLGHFDPDEVENLMAEKGNEKAAYITREQCMALAKSRSRNNGYLGYTPWEDE